MGLHRRISVRDTEQVEHAHRASPSYMQVAQRPGCSRVSMQHSISGRPLPRCPAEMTLGRQEAICLSTKWHTSNLWDKAKAPYEFASPPMHDTTAASCQACAFSMIARHDNCQKARHAASKKGLQHYLFGKPVSGLYSLSSRLLRGPDVAGTAASVWRASALSGRVVPERSLRLARSLLLRVRGGAGRAAGACSTGEPGMSCTQEGRC